MSLDTQLFYALNNLASRSEFGDSLIIFFASHLPYILLIMFFGFVLYSQFSRIEKIRILCVGLASSLIARYGITEIIRFIYHRPRPYADLDVHQLLENSSWSFPSGHAAFFFALSPVVYLYNKKWGIWFFVASATISLGRVAAGIHYPLDILGGALVGVLVAYVTLYFVVKKSSVYASTADKNVI
jgi:undecaprenyl-diphosphatase